MKRAIALIGMLSALALCAHATVVDYDNDPGFGWLTGVPGGTNIIVVDDIERADPNGALIQQINIRFRTFAPWFADDRLERLAALGFFEVLGIDRKSFKIGSWIYIWSKDEKNFIRVYDKVDDDRVNKLQQRYRIDYWITRADVKTRFPKVYEHEGWKVLKVSN